MFRELPPQIMHLTIDLHEDLVQVPAPLRQGPQRSRSLLPDLCGKHRTEPIPPEPHRLMADIDPSFMKQVLDLPQRQGKTDINHHGKANNLG